MVARSPERWLVPGLLALASVAVLSGFSAAVWVALHPPRHTIASGAPSSAPAPAPEAVAIASPPSPFSPAGSTEDPPIPPGPPTAAELALREQAKRRIDALGKEEADFVALVMRVVSREEVFNRTINPKERLHALAAEIHSPEELRDLEFAISELRR